MTLLFLNPCHNEACYNMTVLYREFARSVGSVETVVCTGSPRTLQNSK